MDNWKYVKTDGNPTEEGVYFVTLIYPEWKNGKATGRTLAEISTRWFGNAEKCSNRVMDGQSSKGLVWAEEMGSSYREKVHAWLPHGEIKIANLPDNVEVEEEY
ncbi:hypothetical protein IJI55_03385 [Candidatus Saccharibacteria bacterium]|nr:hypothetical protein [Candidatus Saccharibacteria bacterium]